jgi:hypothetical protein
MNPVRIVQRAGRPEHRLRPYRGAGNLPSLGHQCRGGICLMSSVSIVWKGKCHDARTRYRLLGHLHRLAIRSDEFLRRCETQRPSKPSLSPQGEAPRVRANIETVDEHAAGAILVSSLVSRDPETLVARAREAQVALVENPETQDAPFIALEETRLRGIDFKLFDPRGLYPDADRMSFVFLEWPEHPFLDGTLVKRATSEECGESGAGAPRGADIHLCAPTLRLSHYLEDWTDCLFSWIKFFFIDDFWWHRQEEMQGFADYQHVFEHLQADRGPLQAEEAAFDAVVATFAQHAEHWIGEVQGWAPAEQG